MKTTRDTTYSYPIRVPHRAYPRPSFPVRSWKRIRDFVVTRPAFLRRTLFPQQPVWYSLTVICVTCVILGGMVVAVVMK